MIKLGKHTTINKLAIAISLNQSQDEMCNIAKTMCLPNCPQNPDLNSSKINNAALLHLYSWLLISGELPHWFPNWFYWLVTCRTNDSLLPHLFNGIHLQIIRQSQCNLALTNGIELRGDSCSTMESIFGNRIWSDELCRMHCDAAPAAP